MSSELGRPFSDFNIFKYIPEDRFLAMSSQEKTLMHDLVRILVRLSRTSKRSFGGCVTCGYGTGHVVPICSRCINRMLDLNDPKLNYWQGGKWPQKELSV